MDIFAVNDVLPHKNKYSDVNIFSYFNKYAFIFTVYRLCGKSKLQICTVCSNRYFQARPLFMGKFEPNKRARNQ